MATIKVMTLFFFASTLLGLAACTPRQATLGDAKIPHPAFVEFVEPTIGLTPDNIATARHLELPHLTVPLLDEKIIGLDDTSSLSLSPLEMEKPASIETGKASYYGPGFHGKKTASGSIFDMHQLVAAHPTLPFGTVVRVTNHKNQRTINVRIVDRGPVARIVKQGVIIDLSLGAAEKLGFIKSGRTPVALDIIKLGRSPSSRKYAAN